MKRGWIIGIVFVFLVLFVIILPLLFTSLKQNNIDPVNKGNVTSVLGCVKEGEIYDTEYDTKIRKCCSGLKNVAIAPESDLSVEDKCYWDGTASGYPFIVACSNCGNNECDELESVCSCPQDCAGKGLSNYNTLQDFCLSQKAIKICGKYFNESDLEVCDICPSPLI